MEAAAVLSEAKRAAADPAALTPTRIVELARLRDRAYRMMPPQPPLSAMPPAERAACRALSEARAILNLAIVTALRRFPLRRVEAGGVVIASTLDGYYHVHEPGRFGAGDVGSAAHSSRTLDRLARSAAFAGEAR